MIEKKFQTFKKLPKSETFIFYETAILPKLGEKIAQIQEEFRSLNFFHSLGRIFALNENTVE